MVNEWPNVIDRVRTIIFLFFLLCLILKSLSGINNRKKENEYVKYLSPFPRVIK